MPCNIRKHIAISTLRKGDKCLRENPFAEHMHALQAQQVGHQLCELHATLKAASYAVTQTLHCIHMMSSRVTSVACMLCKQTRCKE